MAQFTIRIPDGMRALIKKYAKLDKRSMNGEIEWLLDSALILRAEGRITPYLDAEEEDKR